MLQYLRESRPGFESQSKFRHLIATKKEDIQVLAVEPPVAEVTVKFGELAKAFGVQENKLREKYGAVLTTISDLKRQGDIISVNPTIEVLQQQLELGQTTDESIIRFTFPARLVPRK